MRNIFTWTKGRVNWRLLLLSLASIVFLSALASFVYVGHFTRYMADDYCLAAAVRRDGFLKFQSSIYFNWTGRFSFLFLAGLTEQMGPAIVPYLSLLAITILLIAAVWAVHQIALLGAWAESWLMSLLVAEVFVFAMINSSHNIVETFYWEAGMLGYAPPLLLFTILVGIVSFAVRRGPLDRSRWLLCGIVLIIAFFAGGLSEAGALLQTAGLLVAMAVCYFRESLRRSACPLLLAGLAGSVSALTIVLLAPGNQKRQAFFPPPPNVFKLVGVSLYYSAGFVGYTIYLSPLTTALLVVCFGSLGWRLYSKKGLRLDFKTVTRLLIVIPLIGFFLIFVCIAAGFYGTSHILPARARIFPQLVFVCTTIWWSYFAGVFLARRFASAWTSKILFVAAVVACALIVLAPLTATWRTLRLVPRARAAAAIWDQMDHEIPVAKANGLKDLTVVAIDDVESRLGAPKTELHLESDPLNWKNKCAAQYYGVDSITAR